MIEQYAEELKNQCVEMLQENVSALAREVETGGPSGNRYLGVHGTIRWGLVHADLSQIVVDIQTEYYRRLNQYATEVNPSMQREHRKTTGHLYPGQIGYQEKGTGEQIRKKEIEASCTT